MRYEKQSFITVPSKVIEWADPNTQVVFMWLCKFIDDNWEVSPSINKLIECTGIKTKQTISDRIEYLVSIWALVQPDKELKKYIVMIQKADVNTEELISEKKKRDKKKKEDNVDVMTILKKWNSFNASIGYGNKIQRQAVEAMLKAYPVEQCLDIIDTAISVQGKKFAPSITNPYELRMKLIKLQQYLENNN